MKINFLKIKKNYKKKDSSLINPGLYWKSVLAFALVVVAISFVFGFYLLRKINQEFEVVNNAQSNSVEVTKRARMDKALEYFNTREERSIYIISSPAEIPNPSL